MILYNKTFLIYFLSFFIVSCFSYSPSNMASLNRLSNILLNKRFTLSKRFSTLSFKSTFPLYSSSNPSPEAPGPIYDDKVLKEFSLLELRIGQIINVEDHPNSDKLYKNTIDLGPVLGSRTILSGLKSYLKPEDLLNQHVVVVCNLKPRTIQGIESNGMVLCASSTSESNRQVVPIKPMNNIKVGDLIYINPNTKDIDFSNLLDNKSVSDLTEEILLNNQILIRSEENLPTTYLAPGNRPNKAFEKVAPFLRTNKIGLACFYKFPLLTSTGLITSSLSDSVIS